MKAAARSVKGIITFIGPDDGKDVRCDRNVLIGQGLTNFVGKNSRCISTKERTSICESNEVGSEFSFNSKGSGTHVGEDQYWTGSE